MIVPGAFSELDGVYKFKRIIAWVLHKILRVDHCLNVTYVQSDIDSTSEDRHLYSVPIIDVVLYTSGWLLYLYILCTFSKYF